MKPSSLSVILICLLGPGLTSCQSPREARIQASSAAFAASDSHSQALIRQGLFDVGFTSEQVTMSLGKPDRITLAKTPAGTAETWVYKNVLAGDTRMFDVATARARESGPDRAGVTPAPATETSTAAVSRSGERRIDHGFEKALATVSLDLVNGRVVAVLVEG